MNTMEIPSTWFTTQIATQRIGIVEWMTRMQRKAQQSLAAWTELVGSDPISAMRTQDTIRDAAWTVKLTGICLQYIEGNQGMDDDATLIADLLEDLRIHEQDALRTVLSNTPRCDYYVMDVSRARVAAHIIKWLERI